MSQQAIDSLLKEERRFDPPHRFAEKAHIGLREEYDKLYRESLESPDAFWRREARDLVFRKKWSTTFEWELPHARWFADAQLNITESCLDRHLTGLRKNKAAIIWEGEPGDQRTVTYAQLHRETEGLARALRKLGVQKGDRVAIYMGMVPEIAVAMLACARVGAVHTVVFGGFAPDALRERIADSAAKLVITQDAGWRRGQVLPLKEVVDKAIKDDSSVQKVIVLRRLGEKSGAQMKSGRDHYWDEIVEQSAD
ncbi:MAG TPA: AMP-binding protein, partial [Polyangiaceae bacterium]|nr:AMP-binding protein [Polyangiaceae bacterium]